MARLYGDVGSSSYTYKTGGWGEQANEFLNEWRGAAEKAKRVNEMLRNSPMVAVIRLAYELSALNVEWQWTSDQGDDDPRLELMREAWEGIKWREHLMDALLFPFYGWDVSTITYRADGGRILWKRFKHLNHETVQNWLLEGDDELTGVQQWPHLWADPIPLDRMIHYRYRANNPEGESILRPAWIPWYFVKNLQQTEAIGLERNLAGLPTITGPEGTDFTESDDENTSYGRALRIVRNVRRDEQGGVVIPFGWTFALMHASGTGAAETDMVINRYNKQILMASLTQFVALGMESVGALATFKGGNDLFTLAVNALVDVIAETFTEQAGKRLLLLNGLEPDGIKLEHSPAGKIDIAELMGAIQSLGDKLTWTPDDEVAIRNMLQLPEKTADELEVLQEEARAAAMEQAQRMGPRMGQPGPQAEADEDALEDEDELHAELYGVDDDMARWERTYRRKMEPWLAAQKRRAVKAAKHG